METLYLRTHPLGGSSISELQPLQPRHENKFSPLKKIKEEYYFKWDQPTNCAAMDTGTLRHLRFLAVTVTQLKLPVSCASITCPMTTCPVNVAWEAPSIVPNKTYQSHDL